MEKQSHHEREDAPLPPAAAFGRLCKRGRVTGAARATHFAD